MVLFQDFFEIIKHIKLLKYLIEYGTYLSLDMPANGTYFVSYEALTKFIVKTMGSESEFWASIFAGGVAGMSYWILGMPADVLKSRLQTGGSFKQVSI